MGAGVGGWRLRGRRLRDLRRLWLQVRWELITFTSLIVLVVGWWGFDEYFSRRGTPRPALDSLYRSLCLFVFEGGDVSGDVPAQLQAARFLAPLVVLAAAIGAAMTVLHRELQSFMARWVVRGHVVVVGLGGRGLQLARQLVDAGHRCAIVDIRDAAAHHSSSARLHGISVVTAGEPDADLVEQSEVIGVLKRAGLRRAKAVVVMTGAPAIDARFACVLPDLQEQGEAPLNAFVEIDDVDSLRSATGQALDLAGDRLEWFSLAERAAKSLLDQLDQLLAVREGPTHRHLVVVGATAVGRSVIVQAARNWSRDVQRRSSGPVDDADRLVLTLVEPARGSDNGDEPLMSDELHLLRRRDPRVPTGRSATHELHALTCDLGAGALTDALVTPPSAVIVTADDDQELLRRSIDVTADLGDGVPIWLCAARSGGIVDLVTGSHIHAGRRRVEVFHLLDTVLRDDSILRGADEELARAVHQAHRRYRGSAATLLDDLDTIAPWDELPVEVRSLNHAIVAAWRRVLAGHGYRFATYTTLGAEATALPESLTEELAVAAHEAWSAEKKRLGYRRGRRRSSDARAGSLTHPDIDVPFEDLPPDSKDWNRRQAAAVPEHLAAAGLELHPRPGPRSDG